MPAKTICLVFSDDYSASTAATLSSFLTHNNGNWNFYFITDGINYGNQQKLTKLVSNYSKKNQAFFISVDKSIVNKFPIGDISKHVTYHAMFRLLIPSLVSEDEEIALYLDSDLIIQSDISDLFNVDFKNNEALAAIADFKYHNRRVKFGIHRYFNSGVLLLNLRYWREHNATEELLSNDVPNWVKLVDQDILNLYFNNKWLEIDRLYNVPAALLYDVKRARAIGLKKSQAKIVHFLGGLKPWDYWLPYSPLYWKYLIRTPYWYQIFKAPITLLNSVFYKIKKTLRR